MLRVAPKRDSYCPGFDSLLCLPLSESHFQLAPPWLRESCQGVRWGVNQRKQCTENRVYAQQPLGFYLNHAYSSDKRATSFPEGAIIPSIVALCKGSRLNSGPPWLNASSQLPSCKGSAYRWCSHFFQPLAFWRSHPPCVSVFCEKLICVVSDFYSDS